MMATTKKTYEDERTTMEFNFDISPVAKQRARICRYGAYTPKETRIFETELKEMAKVELKKQTRFVAYDLFTRPLAVEIIFYLTKPKAKKYRAFPDVRPDLDNYVKSVCDSLNGILWKDDACIVEIHARKMYAYAKSINLKVREAVKSDWLREDQIPKELPSDEHFVNQAPPKRIRKA
jgi:Holliday junction resolvase RusA-like endonuclease